MAVKKGLLLYGPPGTGKTHTIRYLAGALSDHTTLLVTAEEVAFIAEYMALARLLSPSIVVIEDVDLIARDREELQTPIQEALLNRLLNEMDGLRENSEVLFILTTNRPESLEAALASRPGRIDQAIEFPLPDDAARHQLIDLYRRDLEVPGALIRNAVERTEGVSAAFIKELMRRTAQMMAERDGSATTATPPDLDAALNEMLFEGGSLNAKLLGAAVSDGTPRA
jgi:ATP-dependent 26S proteasome regulatory subunit